MVIELTQALRERGFSAKEAGEIVQAVREPLKKRDIVKADLKNIAAAFAEVAKKIK